MNEHLIFVESIRARWQKVACALAHPWNIRLVFDEAPARLGRPLDPTAVALENALLRSIVGELPGLLRRWALADTTERAYQVEEYIGRRLADTWERSGA